MVSFPKSPLLSNRKDRNVKGHTDCVIIHFIYYFETHMFINFCVKNGD